MSRVHTGPGISNHPPVLSLLPAQAAKRRDLYPGSRVQEGLLSTFLQPGLWTRNCHFKKEGIKAEDQETDDRASDMRERFGVDLFIWPDCFCGEP